jgi:hypothetical protein
MKSRGYKGYAVVWEQMWKQRLFTSYKLQTVNQSFTQLFSSNVFVFFVNHGKLGLTAGGYTQVAKTISRLPSPLEFRLNIFI